MRELLIAGACRTTAASIEASWGVRSWCFAGAAGREKRETACSLVSPSDFLLLSAAATAAGTLELSSAADTTRAAMLRRLELSDRVALRRPRKISRLNSRIRLLDLSDIFISGSFKSSA